MIFRELIKQKREEKGWTLRVMAETANITAGTVNRLENGKIEATLLTAISLCQALDISLNKFSELFVGRDTNFYEQPRRTPTYLSLDDVIYCLTIILHGKKPEFFALVADILNQIIRKQGGNNRLDDSYFNPAMLEYLLLEEPVVFQHLEIQYPPAMTPQQIVRLYKNGGIVTMADVGHFIQGLREKNETSLSDLTEKTNVSTNVLQRLELGSLVRLKLNDAIHLAQNLERGDEFLAIVWSAVQFDDRLAREKPWLATLSHSLVKIFRWLEYLDMNDEYQDNLKKYRDLMW